MIGFFGEFWETYYSSPPRSARRDAEGEILQLLERPTQITQSTQMTL